MTSTTALTTDAAANPPQPPPPTQSISRRTTTDDGTLLPAPPSATDTVPPPTDIAALWTSAVLEYERTTGISLTSLSDPARKGSVDDSTTADARGRGAAPPGGGAAAARDVESILALIKTTETRFRRHRHDGSRCDRFRTLVGRTLGPVDRLRGVLGHAAKGAFPPAEAVFAAVGVLINVANGVSADYDRIVELFEDLDGYLHRLKVLEGNVPLSGMPELQGVLVEVFVEVLGLCALGTRYVRMNRVVKTLRNLVSGEDAELKAAYERFHKVVQREGDIVRNATLVGVEKLRVDHRAAHQDVKQSLGKIQKGIEDHESAEERESILTWLSTVDFHDKQRTTFSKHHKGTGEWFLDSDEFQEWFEGEENSILWCPGIPGAGKTVMVSTAVCYVERNTEGSDVAIAYIYCDYKDPKTRSEGEIFGSIAKQLVEQCSPVPPEAKAFRDKYAGRRQQPALEDQVTLVQTLTRNFGTTYLFIDALDECSEETRETVLRSIGDLGDSIRLLVTSRPHIDLHGRFANLSRLDIVARQTDVEAYLKSVVESNGRMRLFAARDPSLKTDIAESLQAKADGMFLLAHLQIVHLCGQSSSKNVRKSLDTLSGDLSSFFEGAMGRVAQQSDFDRNLARTAFSFILYARRPLHLSDLLEALSVEPGDTELDQDSVPELQILLSVTAGMIRVDERTKVVGFVHYTVQQYLEGHLEHLVPYTEVHVAGTCLTYLSFDTFAAGPCQNSQEVFERIQTHAFLRYAVEYGPGHWKRCQGHLSEDWILSFLRDDALMVSMLQVEAAPVENKAKVAGRADWFLYAGKGLPPLHAAANWGLDRVLHRILQGNVDIESTGRYGMTPLMFAASGGHIESVQLLLDHGAEVHRFASDGESTISWAIRNGHRDVVDLLYRYGADPFQIAQNHGEWAPMTWAIAGGYNELVHQILSYCRDPKEKEHQMGFALVLAAEAGARELVQELLDDGAPIESRISSSTSLTFSLSLGHEKTARLLIEHGADVNTRDCYEATPLHWAVGKPSLTLLLLEKGADPNATDESWNAPLHLAAGMNQMECAKELIRHEADPNLEDLADFTPLHLAALHGNVDMVRLLLENGADPNVEELHQWRPLHLAAFRDHDEIIGILRDASEYGEAILADMAVVKADKAARAPMEEYLLRGSRGVATLTGLRAAVNTGRNDSVLDQLLAGADPNGREQIGTGDTALVVAAAAGHTSIGLTLVEHGADVNRPERDGQTPLHSAAINASYYFTTMLLLNGADIEAKYQGATPLLSAVSHSAMMVAEYLVDQGADVNAEDICGRRSLHYSVKFTAGYLLGLLVRKGADVNAQDVWGRTALMWAIERGRARLVIELLDYGADPKLAAARGITPLHVASYIGDEVIVRHLLSFGADCNAKDDCGMTALHVAVMMDHAWVAEMLRERGADEGEGCRWRAGDAAKVPPCQMRHKEDLYEKLGDTTREHLDLGKMSPPEGYSVSDLAPIGQRIAAAREARYEEIANEDRAAWEACMVKKAKRKGEEWEKYSEIEDEEQGEEEERQERVEAIEAGEGWQPSLPAVLELADVEGPPSPIRVTMTASVCEDVGQGSFPS